MSPDLSKSGWGPTAGIGIQQINSFINEQTIKLGPDDEEAATKDPKWWPIFHVSSKGEGSSWIIVGVGSLPKSEFAQFIQGAAEISPEQAARVSALPIGYLSAFMTGGSLFDEKAKVRSVEALAVKEDAYFTSNVIRYGSNTVHTRFLCIDFGGTIYCAFVCFEGYAPLDRRAAEAQDWLQNVRFVRRD